MLIEDKPVEEYLKEASGEKVELSGIGFNIRKTVDVANELKEKGYKVEKIEISTIKRDDRNLSSISIVMKR